VSDFLTRIATLPARLARGAWRFIDPPLKVGRIPFTRSILILQILAALTFLGYTLAKKGTNLPFTGDPYRLEVVMPDAKGLNPVKEPAAGVAGVNAGKVVATRVEAGQAHVVLELDPEMRGKVFNDATVFVRPSSVLQTLIVNIQPGDPDSGEMTDGGVIDAASTDGFVHIDELTGLLDADTQAQAQILIREAAKAFKGREPELRAILAEVGDLTDGATPLAEALAERRRLLSKLVTHTDELFTTVGQRGSQLARAIDAGRRTVELTAAREPELSAATRDLAPVLDEASRSLVATRGLAEPLVPALDELIPAAASVEPAAAKLRALLPELDGLVTVADGLVDDGAEPAALLADGMRGLSGRVRGDQVPALRELVDLVDLLFEYRNGLVQTAENFSGAFSLNHRAGPYAQFAIVSSEMEPEWFGFPAGAARSRGDRASLMEQTLAEMLERVCRDSNPAACSLRFSTPGLPPEPILPAIEPAGEGG